jgi:ubiquinone/menaquinone biosynthesis C-methylase UbiE
MSTSSEAPDPRKELASTYVVSDRSNEEELARLQLQDHLLTAAMGGVLAEQPDPARFERVLDVGCGPGGWLIETARTYQSLSLLVGIDISGKMLDAARERAKKEQVAERMEFHTMDALRMLEFPSGYFGLVNQRAGISWLRRWDWPKLLQEYRRVLCPGGVIRITEANGEIESHAPSLMRLWTLCGDALYQAGMTFTQRGKRLDEGLIHMLEQQGMQDVQKRICELKYLPGTPDGQLFMEDVKRMFRTFKPFLQKWIRLPDDYEEIYQQMLHELQQPDFVATGELVTVWGTKPQVPQRRSL